MAKHCHAVCGSGFLIDEKEDYFPILSYEQ